MKAARFHEYGGPDVLRIVEVDEPHAAVGQIRITVRASGVNPLDWKLRAGVMREFMPLDLPSGTGFEASGVVDEVGEGVTDVAIGDDVFGRGINTAAELAVLTAWARKPIDLSFEEAAGFSTPIETASRVLDMVQLVTGDTVFVHGGAGGVGTALIQFARQRGLTVVASASKPKHEYLRGFGALPVTYGPDMSEQVRAIARDGVRAAFDLVGSGVVPDLITLTRKASNVVSIVDFSAPQFGAQMATAPQLHPERALAEAARLFEAGVFTIPVESTYPLVEIGAAQARSATGRVTGRVAVIVRR